MRMAAILNFMADHPGQAFALTDLVRALKLSRATCHALLASLVEVGYLYRASDKTYVLGPRLAAIGRIAAENLSPVQVAQPEMRRLADEFDVVCSIFVLEGDTIHLRERAASVSHVGYSVPLGTQVKLRVPSAAVFYSWSPAEAVEAWMATLQPPVTPAQWAEMTAAMRFGQNYGFIAYVRDLDAGPTINTPSGFAEDDPRTARMTLLAAMDHDRVYDLASIIAPVFEGTRVAFVLGLMGFDRKMTGSEILAAAVQLKQACQRISDFIG